MSPGAVTEIGFVVRWIALFAALGAIALPLSSLLFSRFADRGAGLSLPLALAVCGVVGYWIGHLAFGTPAAVAGVLSLAGLSALALRRGVAVDWRGYGETMAVFVAAFVFLAAIRAADPGVVAIGGEKFLDYGLLNSLSRTGALPPEDPWFAGERVRYYYGGHMLAALLGALAATPTGYTYNLALAGAYATLVSSAYGLVGAIAADRGANRVRAGLFGAFFVGIASNLATPVRALAWLLPGGEDVADAVGVPLTRGGRETVAHGLDEFGYWDASRVIPGTINEFPLFAFLNGDLHAHMLSLPFLVLAIGLLYAYWEAPAAALRRRRLLAGVAVPVVAGWLALVNTWDFPTVLGLTWLALALAPTPPWTLLPEDLTSAIDRRRDRLPEVIRRRTESPTAVEVARPVVAAGFAAVVGLVGVLVVLPFFLGAASAGGRSLEVVADRSDPVRFLLVHGAFLFAAAWYLSPTVETGSATIRDETIVMALFLTALLWLLEATTLLLVVPLVLVGWYAVRTGRAGYETVLFVAGAGLVATVEIVYFAEGAGPGRLNTVFKTYVHVWVIWSIAAGVALGRLTSGRPAGRASAGPVETGTPTGRDGLVGEGGRPASDGGSDRAENETSASDDGTATTRRRALAVVLALACALSVYGGLALVDHFGENDAGTLDARHDVRADAPDEAAAFEWLADREGQPRIVEAPTPPKHTYGTSGRLRAPPSRYVNGASTFSGLPTIAGWTHSADYHGDAPYRERVADAETVFTGNETARAAVLAEYEIRYVYVGPNERGWYDLADLESDEALTVAATFDDVTIYRVDRSALPA